MRLSILRIPLLACLLTAAGLAAESGSPGPRNQATLFVGDTAPQIAAGASWSTEIQVMHSRFDGAVESFTIRFFDDSGAALSIPVVGLGETTGVSGVLQPRGAMFFELVAPPEAALRAGFSVIESSTLGGAVMNAVLTQKVDGRPDFQASVPSLDRNGTNFQFPFRNDGAFTTTVAFVSRVSQNVRAVARSVDGSELCSQMWQMGAGEHVSFLASDRLPCSADTRGVLEIVPDDSGAAIAFLFNDFGAFTTQLPFEIVPDQ